MFKKHRINYVIRHSDPESEKVNLVGFEAACLFDLQRFGRCVFEGFVLSSEFFDAFLLQTKLIDKVSDLLVKINLNINLLEELSTKIQELIYYTEIPKSLLMSLKLSFENLKNTFKKNLFLVTASNIIPEQYITKEEKAFKKTVSSFENFVEAVKTIWSNLFSAKSIKNRIEKNYRGEISVAIICRVYFLAEKSGLVFISDTNRVTEYSEVKLFARFGSRVNKLSLYDMYSVSTQDLSIIKKNIVEQKDMIVEQYKINSIGEIAILRNTIELSTEFSKTQKLQDDIIINISKLLLILFGKYKTNLFVEWIITGGNYVHVEEIYLSMPEYYQVIDIQQSDLHSASDLENLSTNDLDHTRVLNTSNHDTQTISPDVQKDVALNISLNKDKDDKPLDLPNVSLQENDVDTLESVGNRKNLDYISVETSTINSNKSSIQVSSPSLKDLKNDEILLSSGKNKRNFIYTNLSDQDSEQYNQDISKLLKKIEYGSTQYIQNYDMHDIQSEDLIKQQIVLDVSNLSTGKLINVNNYYGAYIDLEIFYLIIKLDVILNEVQNSNDDILILKKFSESVLTFLQPLFNKLEKNTKVICKLSSIENLYKFLPNSFPLDRLSDLINITEIKSILALAKNFSLNKVEFCFSNVRNVDDYLNLKNKIKENVNVFSNYASLVEIAYPCSFFSIEEFVNVSDGVVLDFENFGRYYFCVDKFNQKDEQILLKLIKSSVKKLLRKSTAKNELLVKKIYIKCASERRNLIYFASLENLKIILFNLVKSKNYTNV
ncbi:MAG: hypothetical protein NZZ41_03560 [Candidatus Dojkabacteria bacterium]|nr:hypothetical protein [Candidatus Dojkabacteria bacterium]